MALIREQVDPITYELSNADIHQKRVAMLDRRLHRLAPAGDHLQMKVLGELNTHFPKVLRANPHILQHLGIVVRHFTATHGATDVVVRDPHLIAYQPWS
ncbi:hypothetical protein D9M71_593150 [compost metagenome]